MNGISRRLTKLEEAASPTGEGRCRACGGVCTPTIAALMLHLADFVDGAEGCRCASHVCPHLVDDLLARIEDGEEAGA